MSHELAAFISAASFAADRHRKQRRKDVEASPYINHPLAVAKVLVEEADVHDPNILSAALLHDTVEDTETMLEEIGERFGQTVAKIVAEVTDEKSLPKAERKRLQIQNAIKKSDAAKLVKLADKICNLRDLVKTPPIDWPLERRVDYFYWAGQVANGLALVNEALDDAFDRVWGEGLTKILDNPEVSYSRCVVSVGERRLIVISQHDFDGGVANVEDMFGNAITSWSPTTEMSRDSVAKAVKEVLGWKEKESTGSPEENDNAANNDRILLAGQCDNRDNDLRSTLESARDAPNNRFVVLERSGQVYMQCLCNEAGWLLEKREGDERRHFRAIMKSVKPEGENGDEDLMSRLFAKGKMPSYNLDFGQVLEALSCYDAGKPEPVWLEWEHVEV